MDSQSSVANALLDFKYFTDGLIVIIRQNHTVNVGGHQTSPASLFAAGRT
jgi:hypothetical protein